MNITEANLKTKIRDSSFEKKIVFISILNIYKIKKKVMSILVFKIVDMGRTEKNKRCRTGEKGDAFVAQLYSKCGCF